MVCLCSLWVDDKVDGFRSAKGEAVDIAMPDSPSFGYWSRGYCAIDWRD